YRFAISNVPEDETGRVLGCYEFTAYDEESNTPVPDLTLSPGSRSYFYYPTYVQNAAQRTPGLSLSSEELGIFWYNGVEYVKCGGTISNRLESIVLETQRLGTYRVQRVLRATSFSLSQIWPRKTFTPNGDGINDTINFNFENPRESVVTGKIFDITGAFVATMTTGLNGRWSLQWDGRDSKGSFVDKGVYIYQIEAEGKIINGTIVVAK
ncbi:MAG: T9SS type A sorting domain-containing protein, partial [Elusimicrobia bacterium]|nr:T9SS type A sorting domain-containing protein [Elusimicrobiota bacterium]MBD3412117.1 T9SS type A sorting domain-containing protein [Elusimicrobiota bacterium]